jgi:Flp pilus assembly protein TadD
MSSDVADEVCTCCGVAAVDDVKLKDCDAGCGIVKYCSDKCQKHHRPQHEEECKKRSVELRDRDLFTQPDGSDKGECPICFLPMPIDPEKSVYMSCCSKLSCKGCHCANGKSELEQGLEHRCAFCREPMPKLQEEFDKRVMKRVKKNCPVAMNEMGKEHYHEGDYETAIEYYKKAAELGVADAHYNLSSMYEDGLGVEKDEEKEVYHLEQAAIAGHPRARDNLGIEEWNNGRYERARKHFIIAANLGWHNSLKCLRKLYADGLASKEDYANALRAYQAAEEATKSSERELAEAY